MTNYQIIAAHKKPRKEKVATSLETKKEILRLMKEGFNGTQIDEELKLGSGTSIYHINKYKKFNPTTEGETLVSTKIIEVEPVYDITKMQGKATDKQIAEDKIVRKYMSLEQKLKLFDLHVQNFHLDYIAESTGLKSNTIAKFIYRMREGGHYNRLVKQAKKRVGLPNDHIVHTVVGTSRTRGPYKKKIKDFVRRPEVQKKYDDHDAHNKHAKIISAQAVIAPVVVESDLAKELERAKMKNEILLELLKDKQ